MAIIKKNPNVPDYFIDVSGVKVGASNIEPILPLYEDTKVLLLPDFKPKIDFDFWASLDTTTHPTLKKLVTAPSLEHAPERDAQEQEKRLERAGIPKEIATEVSRQMSSVLDQALPIYRQLFSGYRFTKGQVVWRLNEIYAEKMHIDVYGEPLPHHFARMFINLDTQPRIWHTSWRTEEIIKIARQSIPRADFERLSANDLWTELNRAVFGRTADEWWVEQQKHIVFFEPGDVWLVDSRLIGHQIFYGRRAVSIDFYVDPTSMLNPNGHYLNRAEAARAIALAA